MCLVRHAYRRIRALGHENPFAWKGNLTNSAHKLYVSPCIYTIVGVLWDQQLHGLGRRSQRQQLSRELLFKRPGGKRLI